MFLHHEGFLGAMGAFMSYENHDDGDSMNHQLVQQFPVSMAYPGSKICCSLNGDLNDNESIDCAVLQLSV